MCLPLAAIAGAAGAAGSAAVSTGAAIAGAAGAAGSAAVSTGGLAALSIGAAGVSAGISTAGAIAQGNLEQQIAARNVALSERAAADARKRGDREAAALGRAGRRAEARVMSIRQGQGFVLGGGTELDILGEVKAENELAVLTALNNAEREAYGFEIQAQDFRVQGQVAQQRSRFAAAGSIIGGAGSVAGQFFAFNRLGAFDFGGGGGGINPTIAGIGGDIDPYGVFGSIPGVSLA